MKLAPVLLWGALVACGGASQPAPKPITNSPPATVPPAAPSVTTASALATDDGTPPIIVLVDAKGARSLAAAASWADVAAGKWSAGPKPASDEMSYRYIKEAVILGKDPKGAVESFVESKEDVSLRTTGTAYDDPPPPEEEDKPDDGEDESGGTGTAMALDEGKMGKKDSDRSAGKYTMRKQPAGEVHDGGNRGPLKLSAFSARPGGAMRHGEIVGEVTDAKPTNAPAVVIAEPSAKAIAVVKAVTETEAMIGVANGNAIRALKIQFHHAADAVWQNEPDRWLEVRVATTGLVVEAVPSKDTPLAWADLGKLKAALGEARDRRKLSTTAPVDVLVAPDVSAQQLVDVLVALEGTGVRMIGLGAMPNAEQLALRGKVPPPSVAIGQPNAMGNLDKADIRAGVKDNIKFIRYCYEKALLAKPDLAGTVQVQFLIKPDGKVAQATASGVDPDVASCVAEAIKKIQFPKPKGGGSVQVNYPFTFHQQP